MNWARATSSRQRGEIKEDKNVSLEPDKEADKHIKVLDEKTSVATEYKEKDITTVKQTNSMIIRFSVTPKGGKKVGYLGVFLTTIPEAENLYGYELYYNYKNVLSPSIASITIKEGEKERPFGSGYTTKINGKETEFELKITFNEDKKINSDVFIDIFSNTNAALAKPTLSGTALHRFKMKMAKIQSIITYHIYYDGRIEKHIPKEIAEEFKQKYKYVYHDEKGNEHEVCVAEWHTIKEKEIGVFYSAKPTHSEIISDENVSEGKTSQRVRYKNGDIAEYGTHPTKGKTWILYKAKNNEVELLKMPDSLDYKKDKVFINYIFY